MSTPTDNQPRAADAEALGGFVDALFRYADEGTHILFRAFDQHERGRPPVHMAACKVNGDLSRVAAQAAAIATKVANAKAPAVFAPPVCTFNGPDRARSSDVANGVALSVDLDNGNTAEARVKLEYLLGPCTQAVASGGETSDDDTGEVLKKLHLHWRLSEPTRTPGDHDKLREARWFAAVLVGGDTSAAPLAHPLRWPGSWNMKTAQGRMATIIASNPDNEIHLEDALVRLQEAVETAGLSGQRTSGPKVSGVPEASPLDIAAALDAIPNSDVGWDEWNRIAMATWRATGGSEEGCDAWVRWSAKSSKHNAEACLTRWKHFSVSPPSRVGAGTLFFLAKQHGWRRVAKAPADVRAPADPDVEQKQHTPAEEPLSEEVDAKIQAAVDANDQRPEIQIAGGAISREVDAAEAALIAADSGIYQRGALLVRTGMVSIDISDNRKRQGLRILPVEEHFLLEAMTQAARWLKFDGRSEKWREINAPTLAVKVLLARVGQWMLPLLTGIVSAPTLRPDGSLLTTPGYDAATGLLFDPCGQTFPTIPDNPTRAEAEAALQILKDLISTFPFVRDADRSVALSAFLTASIRRSLRTAPLHAFTAPAAGTGKGKLADMASSIATGREAGVIAQGKTEEEMEKRLGAMLLGGETVVAIDNCTEPLGGDFLCQVMTQPVVRVRILGESKIPEVLANSFITATGNNLSLLSDMNRRALLCSLDAQCERPELREFDTDPVEETKGERGKYIAATLTILRAYHVAGRPQKSVPLGSFIEWSDWVRNALIWLGEADPVSTMEDSRKLDPDLEALTEIMAQWHRLFGTGSVTVKQVVVQASRDPDLRDALLSVAGKGPEISNGRLGKWLARKRRCVVGNFRLNDTGEKVHNTATWKLEVVEGRTSHAE